MRRSSVIYPSVGGSTPVATKTEIEGLSGTGFFICPGRQQYHPATAKAWVSIDGTGTIAILASYNVSGITDNGTGDYTVTFDTDFSDTNYAMSGHRVINSNYNAVSYHKSGGTKSTGSCRIASHDTAALSDTDMCDAAFLGPQ